MNETSQVKLLGITWQVSYNNNKKVDIYEKFNYNNSFNEFG